MASEEEDFLSAELEIVPAGKARELGMDASMILAYGQDDRVCAYTSLVAMLEVEAPEKTSCCLLVDKGGDRKRRSNQHAVSFLRKHHGRAACTCR